MKWARYFVIFTLCACANGHAPYSDNPGAYNGDAGQGQVTVDASSSNGPILNRQGFLHGLSGAPPQISLLQNLKPAFWRINEYTNNIFVKNIAPTAKSTFVLIDAYANAKGVHYDQFDWSTWDWTEYSNFVSQTVSQAAAYGHIEYWDIWPEPDWSFHGSQANLVQMYITTVTAIRAQTPSAKIIGPDLSHYDIAALEAFIVFITQSNLRFDGISWHEFGQPEDIPAHVQAVRNLFLKYPIVCNPTCPEIHINEYAGPEYHLVPGWTLGFLQQFEETHIDVASKACWSSIENNQNISDCISGVDGLFTAAGLPRPMYWVHRAYADLVGGLRLTSSQVDDVAGIHKSTLASKNNADQSLTILSARFSCGAHNKWCANVQSIAADDQKLNPANYDLIVQNYPYAKTSVRVIISRIPNENTVHELANPIQVSDMILPITKDPITAAVQDLHISLPQVQDGDVYKIQIQ